MAGVVLWDAAFFGNPISLYAPQLPLWTTFCGYGLVVKADILLRKATNAFKVVNFFVEEIANFSECTHFAGTFKMKKIAAVAFF